MHFVQSNLEVSNLRCQATVTQEGSGASNRTVTFELNGPGSLIPDPAEVLTDNDGHATVTFTAGAAAVYSIVLSDK